jgi:acylphosphatase
MTLAKQYRVRGRVQGVGYRYFALENALRLGVFGYVRNLPGGDVELHVEGEEKALAALYAELQRGPGFAHVTSVIEEDAPVTGRYSSFSIRG